MNQIFFKFSESLAGCRYYRLAQKFQNLRTSFREKVGQSANRPKFISPPNGGRSPRTKTIFVRVPRAKISKGQVGEGGPRRGWTRKSATPPKFWTQFSRKRAIRFFFNFYVRRGHLNLKFPHGRFRPRDPWRLLQRKQKKIYLGRPGPQIWPPTPISPRT